MRILRWMFRTFEGRIVAGTTILLILALAAQAHSLNETCKNLMSLARSSRDSLDATIACQQARSDAAMANAVAGSGAAIGFGIGSRR